MRCLIITAVMALASSVQAHDVGCGGKPVPAEIRAQCCGKADARNLSESDVHHEDDHWIVTGLGQPIPDARAEPSPDGCYWIFTPLPLGSAEAMSTGMSIYCFFVPYEL